MMYQLNKGKKRNLLTGLVSVSLLVAYCIQQGILRSSSLADILRKAADGCFFAAGIMFCVGLLSFAKNGGLFMMFRYGIHQAIAWLARATPTEKAFEAQNGEEKYKRKKSCSYPEFVEMVSQKEKVSVKPYAQACVLLMVSCIVLSLLCTFIAA